MSVTVSRRFIISFSLVVGVMLGGDALMLRELYRIRGEVQGITTHSEPLNAQAYEMEINSIGTASGVLKYVTAGDEAGKRRVDEDSREFMEHLAEFRRLARTAEEQQLADKAAAIYGEFSSLGRKLMNNRDEREARYAAMRDSVVRLDRMLGLANSQTDPAWRTFHDQLLDVSFRVSDFLLFSRSDGSDKLREIAVGILDAVEHLDVPRAGSIPAREFDAIVAAMPDLRRQTSDLLNTHVELLIGLGNFIGMRGEIDDLLDDHIQASTINHLRAANERAGKAIALAEKIMLGTIAVGLILVVVSTFLLTRRLIAPLHQLAEGASRIGAGELGYRLRISGNDELTAVAVSFNEMADKREKADREIREAYSRVEAEVAERTRELRATTLRLQHELAARTAAESERDRMEAKLLQTQKLESMGVLAGGIAHDFNNLLTGILGNLSLARSELPTDSPICQYCDPIEAAARQAAELCKQLLAYSGRGRFVLKEIDLNVLLEETVHLIKLSISKKAVIKFNLNDKLPLVIADATQIRQVIMNLVINASEAIGDRSGLISVTTGVMRVSRQYMELLPQPYDIPEGDYVYVEVSDNGPGMSVETLKRIFDPFFTTKFTGRGLGLAAVLGIVRSHKGALKVYSEPGRGATFKVMLPCADGTLARPTQSKNSLRAWRGHGTVLLADDEETVRVVATRMLEALGFDVIPAVDGAEALALFRKHADSLRLVVLDLTMPHMSGEQVFSNIHRERPMTPVLLISGFSEEEATDRFAGKGLAGFLHKPFDIDEVTAKLRELLGENA